MYGKEPEVTAIHAGLECGIIKEKYPDIIQAGSKEPYYTNSTHLPVGHTADIFEALNHQDGLQSQYTGGTVFHGFLGESIEDPEVCKMLVRRIAENFHLPYYTITPTFTICPVHGYISGEHFFCPYTGHEHEVEQEAENMHESHVGYELNDRIKNTKSA